MWGVWSGVECPCPAVSDDIVTPRCLFYHNFNTTVTKLFGQSFNVLVALLLSGIYSPPSDDNTRLVNDLMVNKALFSFLLFFLLSL